MAFENLDIKGLSLLWLATADDNPVKAAIEGELQIRIENNIYFSREHFVHLLLSGRRSFGVDFVPTSESYKNYGHHRTLHFLISDEEGEILLNNIRKTPPINTYGYVRAEILVENVPNDMFELMKNKGFNTKDVLDII
ncbi:MAG: hypothetical protein RLZZ367_1961 [Bacteroidota bacterium]|jgi:hypothetical protein